MRLTFPLTLLLALPTITSNAQARYAGSRQGPRVVVESRFVQRYADSLSLYKQRLDSIPTDSFANSSMYKSMANKVGCGNLDSPHESFLFLPLMFSHVPAAHILGRDSAFTSQSYLDKYVDHALMNIYLNRPDLVIGSEARLDSVGPDVDPHASTVAILPNIADGTQVTPVEPVAVPVRVAVKKPNFWTFIGDNYLQFLQNYVSGNWYQGGSSSYSLVGNVTFQANYNNKQKVKWGNKLELQLGLITNSGDSIHKFTASQNIIRYTSSFGLQATKKWYYTLQLIAYTQFVKGYNVNDATLYSDFMSPFNLNVSLGMDYNVDWLNHRLKGSTHLAPFALNYKYVGRRALEVPSGLREGHSSLVDFGSEITLNLVWQLADMIKWTTRIYAYTTYKRFELEWENTIAFQLTKYIGTNVYLYPRFDDGTPRVKGFSYWQFKEYASVGFAYSF